MPEPIFAQVLLPPRTGTPLELITAQTLHAATPDAHHVAHVKARFEEAGFETGDLVGVSFPISAPQASFEAFFGVSLVQDAQGVRCRSKETSRETYELPLEDLPPDLQGHVEAVTLGEPLAFGPEQFS